MINTEQIQTRVKFKVSKNKRRIWFISTVSILVSVLAFIISWTNPSIKSPLRPGLDFTGGTQIKLERLCDKKYCSSINPIKLKDNLSSIDIFSSKDSSQAISNVRVQLIDGYKSVILRLPFLSASQGKLVIDSLQETVGPYEDGGISVDTIGPSLGSQLLRSSFISLIAAFAGIAIYISFRFDRKYAFLALLALAHDVIIVCGVFSWLGILYQIEVDSLFAVSLLTIAGYSVNDTVVVFDRIRELNRLQKSLTKDLIDDAVSATLTRTLYTSGSTLLPLISLIIFGGESLYWFAISLSIGVVVGSWSSIALAPSLLSLNEKKIISIDSNTQSIE